MKFGIIIRILIACLVVGVVMSWLGITPLDVYERIARLIYWVYRALIGLFGGYGSAIVTGAAVVLPLLAVRWLLKRRS